MRTGIWAFVLGAALVGPGMASAGPCDSSNETIYALTGPEYRIDGEPVLARSAFACGRYWSSANLMERAVIQRGSTLQRFNLAATYAQTGRYDQAETLYMSVIDDGDYVRARADSSTVKAGEPEAGFGLASEASRRLAALRTMRQLFGGRTPPATAQASSSVPRTAEQAGTNAVGLEPGQGPTAAASLGVDASALEGGVSDLEALQRDGLLTPQ